MVRMVPPVKVVDQVLVERVLIAGVVMAVPL
jgi:hypothetical protein